jgi:hypothetical protein
MHDSLQTTFCDHAPRAVPVAGRHYHIIWSMLSTLLVLLDAVTSRFEQCALFIVDDACLQVCLKLAGVLRDLDRPKGQVSNERLVV